MGKKETPEKERERERKQIICRTICRTCMVIREMKLQSRWKHIISNKIMNAHDVTGTGHKIL